MSPAARVGFWPAAATAVGLSAFFLVAYGSASYLTSLRNDVGTWYYAWEQYIPFVPEMIVPYMSIDLLFFLAPFLCRDRNELRVLCWRVGVAILAASLIFLIFPLQLAVPRPVATGWAGEVYNWFTSVDRPYNLCPSLHIALRTILAVQYARHLRGSLKWFSNLWFSMVGLSTLLLYQHHFIDIVGGFVLAVAVIYAIGAAPWRVRRSTEPYHALLYATIAAACVATVLAVPELGWILLWPMVACGAIAVGYLGLGAAVFRRQDGRIHPAARLVLGPVLLGQRLSWWYYSRRSPAVSTIDSNLAIGRLPTRREADSLVGSGVTAVVDLCVAFSTPFDPRQCQILHLPVLDLTAPTIEQLQAAVDFIERNRTNGRVLVHCKAGYSRSAAIVGAWLLSTGRASTVEDVCTILHCCRPEIVIRPEIRECLDQWQQQLASPTHAHEQEVHVPCLASTS